MNSVKRIRNANYTDMQEDFDALYEGSKEGKVFGNLFPTIVSEDNILLAVRSIRANKGSKTPGGRPTYNETNEETIARYLNNLELKPSQLKKLNQLRKAVGLNKV